MFVKLALEEDGKTPKVSEDGKPIFIDDKNSEVPVDVPSMYQKIIDLGKENKGHRESNEKLKTKFSIFDDIEDIEAWKAEAVKALETVSNFNEKDWLKAEKVESMKRQMNEAHKTEIDEVKASVQKTIEDYKSTVARKDSQIFKLTILSEFSKSPLFTGENRKTTMTPDAAEAIFGKNFKVEESPTDPDKLLTRVYYDNGELIYSAARPGEPADFHEGMASLWEQYPQKDNYIRGDRGGSGAQGGQGGGREKEDTSDIATLQKQYQEAVAAKKTTLAISLKNKIWDLKRKQQAA